MQKFGCVLFDLSSDNNGNMLAQPGSGWASIDGKDSFRIKNISELNDSILWWTNLSQEIFWKSGAVRYKKLKAANYLRTDMYQLKKELGLIQPEVTIAYSCQIFSEIFSKVMRLAIEYYKLKEFNEKDLGSDLKNLLLPNDKNINVHVDEALLRSYQDLVICNHEVVKEDHYFIQLKRPRYFHSKLLLETAIPINDGEWEFVSLEKIPKENNKRMEFLMSKNRPFIAKINIDNFITYQNDNINLNKLLNLGVAIGAGGQTKDRNWVAQPELMYLLKFANLEIQAAFLAPSYEDLSDKIKLPYLGELSDFSISLGLLSESLWTGISARSINPIGGRSKNLVSPRACWLKSADKFFTFMSAMLLSSSGFEVISYGYGGVNVSVQKTEIDKLVEIAKYAGLSIPINLLKN